MVTSWSTTDDFLAQDAQRADIIAMGALFLGCLAAMYARRQSEEAKKARISAELASRLPHRLDAFRAMNELGR